MSQDQPDITQVLQRLGSNAADPVRDLLPMLYAELKEMAERQFRSQRKDHTLQPTVLVHEAFLKLVGRDARWQDRKHFFAVASTAMRQILVNHARDRSALKRGGANKPVSIEHDPAAKETPLDVLALDEAMKKLAQIDPRKHQVVELRYFGGLSVEEVAEVMDISRSTVEADWRVARAYLASQINPDSSSA